jgi:hypothetical protein
MSIKWQDKVTNMEVLQKAKIPSLFTTLSGRRLRWLGHLIRMPNRIPKPVLFGELKEGGRTRGRPKLRFKDTCKASLLEFQLDTNTCEALAEDCTAWRAALSSGIERDEINLA